MQSLQVYDDDHMMTDENDSSQLPAPLHGQTALDDGMAVDDHNAHSISKDNELMPSFRTKSLVLATFPWLTSIPMIPTSLTGPLRKDDERGFVRPSLYDFTKNHI